MRTNIFLCCVAMFACSPKTNMPTQEKCLGSSLKGFLTAQKGAIAEATVAIIRKWENEALVLTLTNEDGVFSACVPEGEYSITVTAPGFAAAYSKPSPASELAKEPIRLAMKATEAIIESKIESRGSTQGAHIRAIRLSESVGDIFYTPLSDTEEIKRFSLQEGFEYRLDVVGSAKALAVKVDLRAVKQISTTLRPIANEVLAALPSKPTLEWMRSASIQLNSTSASVTDFGDLQRLTPQLEGIKMLGFGENSHGVHEFFELKHRFMKFAVAELGYTVFALEAGFAEGLAIDRYIQGGAGEPNKLVSNLGYWTWDIHEIVNIIQWMREYNLSKPPPKKPVRFYGIDMQNPVGPFRNLSEFADRYSTSLAAQLKSMAVLGDKEFAEYRKLSEPQRVQLCEETAKTIAVVEQNKSAFVERVGLRGFRELRQNAVVLDQGCRYFTDEYQPSFRDQSMAANARWIQIQEGADTKMVISAHNGHVSKASDGWSRPMGSFLSKSLGTEYLALAQFFQEGEMRAWDMREKDETQLSVLPIQIAPPRVGLANTLAGVGPPIFFLGVRTGLSPSARQWLSTPMLSRDFSARYSVDNENGDLIDLAAQFDALVFVQRVTATKVKPTGLRGPKSR